jgi:hypothetical protein
MFHSSNPTLFGRPDGVLGQSEMLWRTIGGLRRVSHELSENMGQATIEARRLLAALSTSLSTYFDASEANGYFAAITAECPSLVEPVRALSEARERLQLSVTSVRRLAFRSTDAPELGLRIDGVLDGFEAHERSECELLQRFFLAGGKQTDGRLDAS